MRRRIRILRILVVPVVCVLGFVSSAVADMTSAYDATYGSEQSLTTVVVFGGWTEKDLPHVDSDRFVQYFSDRFIEIVETERRRIGGEPRMHLYIPTSWTESGAERLLVREARDDSITLESVLVERKKSFTYPHVRAVLDLGWARANPGASPLMIYFEQFVGGRSAIDTSSQAIAAGRALPESVDVAITLHGGFNVQGAPDHWYVEHLAQASSLRPDFLNGSRIQVEIFERGDTEVEKIPVEHFRYHARSQWLSQRVVQPEQIRTLSEGRPLSAFEMSGFFLENMRKIENMDLAPRVLAQEVTGLLLQFHEVAVEETQRFGAMSTLVSSAEADRSDRIMMRAVERLEAVNSAMDAFRDVIERMGERELAARLRPTRH